jgi:hypothetical protein
VHQGHCGRIPRWAPDLAGLPTFRRQPARFPRVADHPDRCRAAPRVPLPRRAGDLAVCRMGCRRTSAAAGGTAGYGGPRALLPARPGAVVGDRCSAAGRNRPPLGRE